MSYRAQFRAPAHAGIRPKTPDSAPDTSATATKILTCLNMPEARLERLSMDRKDAAFYHARDAHRHVFVRIDEAGARAHHKNTENVARWLKEQGIAANVCLDNYPVSFDGNRLLYAYTYIDGHYLEPTMDNMRALGRSVAALHTTLDQHPDKKQFEEKTKSWLSMIFDMRKQISKGHRAGPEPELLQKLACDDKLDFIANHLPRCICHGDLNVGNITQDNQSGDIIFFDFEDVTHSVLAPVFELVRMIERFILIQDLDDDNKIVLGRCFLNAYRETRSFDGGLTMALKSHNLRSLCLLAVIEEESISIAPSEWSKFFMLFHAAEDAKKILSAMGAE